MAEKQTIVRNRTKRRGGYIICIKTRAMNTKSNYYRKRKGEKNHAKKL